MQTIRLLTTLALATGLIAQAPVPPGPGANPPPTDDAKAYLGLTDTQIQALGQLRQTMRQALQPMMDQISQQQEALQKQLEAGSTDAAALGRMLVGIQTIRKQIETAQTGFRAQAVNLLTAQQKAKLQTLQDASKGGTIPQAAGLGLLSPPESEYGPGGPGPRGPGGVGPHPFGGPPARN